MQHTLAIEEQGGVALQEVPHVGAMIVGVAGVVVE